MFYLASENTQIIHGRTLQPVDAGVEAVQSESRERIKEDVRFNTSEALLNTHIRRDLLKFPAVNGFQCAHFSFITLLVPPELFQCLLTYIQHCNVSPQTQPAHRSRRQETPREHSNRNSPPTSLPSPPVLSSSLLPSLPLELCRPGTVAGAPLGPRIGGRD